MHFRFKDDKLRLLWMEGRNAHKLPVEAIHGFARAIGHIRAASDIRYFYNIKSLHFEKLLGRTEQYSLRLNKQWRLIVELETDENGNLVVIIGIEDYHH